MKKLLSLFLLLCIICPLFAGCSLDVDNIGDVINDAYDIVGDIIDYAGESAGKTDKSPQNAVSIDDVGEFAGEPYITVNGNKPSFSATELTTEAYEFYSDLDILGRCGYAMACIGVELMPTEERGSIGQVKPSGWQTVKYDIVDGKYLYNRCHLIGFQLTGENANTKNLITGTRYMNVDGMLPFENMVADYIKDTENHVLYRVTPIFQGLELVARGVQMEAYSVEDNGEGICLLMLCRPPSRIRILKGRAFHTMYTYAQCAHMLVHACTHVHMHTHTCPSSSRSPGRCALALPRPQLESTSALGPTVYAAPARTQSATGQERPCPLPGEGVEVPGPATTDTYRYSQDGRLDRGPSVLPAVYDQDEPDASVLQAETRGHGQHAPGGLAMAAARLREELGVNSRP